MPSANVFAQFGFFVRRDFLDADSCCRLIVEVSAAPPEPSRVVRNGVDHVLDEETRKTISARVDPPTRREMRARLAAATPDLERHFDMPLGPCEAPGFLIYNAGAFFSPHRDAGPDDPPDIRRRSISAIVFLNAPSADSGYEGGELRFHRLLDGDPWEACPLTFDAEPGMLVAFRSETLHEVRPVILGRRFTVVTWFPSREI
ncbi:MAG: 2OG-Fe(II) oxygenase [Vicinamibacterales bacterium]